MKGGRLSLRTDLCRLLGTDYPIVQSGMGSVAGPDLAAAVSQAGALGVLGAVHLDPQRLREAIREVRARTDRPFGVNLLLPPDIRPPAPRTAVEDALVDAVQSALNPMRRRLGIPQHNERPAPPPDTVPGNIEVLLEERVPVFSIGLGNPGRDLVDACHERGIQVIAMVASVDDARDVEAAGVDAVVAQGGEAGGHRSHFRKPDSLQHGAIGTLTLVPQVAAAVRVPVLAAGGIASGRGLAAALALGAAGALIGTRFLATQEAMAPTAYKEALVRHGSDDTVVTDVFSGRYARTLRNRFVEAYTRSGAPVLPFLWQQSAATDVHEAATARGDADYLPLWAGQSVGMIGDLPKAGEVVDAVVAEARHVLTRDLPDRVRWEP